MTSIKPPGSTPVAPIDVTPNAPVDPLTSIPSTSVSRSALSGVTSAPRAEAAATQAVLQDLKTARITPDEAVRRLATHAIEQAGCPPSLRPAVESRIRTVLANDPGVGALLRRMGATAPTDED